MSESPPETNGTNRRDEEKSQKEIINFNFEKKLLSGILFLFLALVQACRRHAVCKCEKLVPGKSDLEKSLTLKELAEVGILGLLRYW